MSTSEKSKESNELGQNLDEKFEIEEKTSFDEEIELVSENENNINKNAENLEAEEIIIEENEEVDSIETAIEEVEAETKQEIIPANKKIGKPKIIKEILPNTAESYSFSSYFFSFFIAIALSVFFSLPYFVSLFEETSFLYLFEMQFMEALNYMNPDGEYASEMKVQFAFSKLYLLSFIPGLSYLVPILDKGQYLLMYPLPFSFMALVDYLPYTSYSMLLPVGTAISQILFVCTIFLCGITMRLSSRASLGAVCISLISLYLYALFTYKSLLFIDLLFASFCNLSLLFFYKAWIKRSSFFFLLFAFFFMALAFLTKGSLAILLPLCVSITFLILHGNFRRINDKDGIAGLFLFLFILLIWFAVIYGSGKTKYFIELFALGDFSSVKFEFSEIFAKIKNIFSLHSIHLYLSIFCIIFLFFLPIPIFSEWKGYFKNLIIKFKLGRASNLSFIENNAIEKTNDPQIIQDSKERFAEYVQASAMMFYYCVLIVGLCLFIIKDSSDFTPIIILMPSVSLLLSKSFMKFKPKTVKAYTIYWAVLLLLAGFLLLPSMAMAYIRQYFPTIVESVPELIIALYTIAPTLSFVGIGFIIFALVLFFMQKNYPQRVLHVFTTLSCAMAFLAYFTVIPSVSVYMADNELPMPKQNDSEIITPYQDLLDTPIPYEPYIDENASDLSL